MKNPPVWILIVVFFCGSALAAEFVVDLAWQDNGFSRNLPVENRVREPFSKEPDLAGQTAFRGKVWLEEAEPTGLLWLKQSGKLFLDLNRDGDLTNDPDGVLNKTTRDGGPDSEHWFNSFTIQHQSEVGTLSYVIDARISNYNDNYFYPYFSLRSGYMGQFEQNERKWEFSVADLPDHPDDRRFECCLALPKQRGYPSFWNVPESVFFGGQNYAMKLQWTQKDDKPLLQAIFTEAAVPMGLLEIPGKEIQALSLKGVNTIVFPDISDRPVPVPAGQYRCRELHLNGKDQYRRVIPQRVDLLTCDVPENGVAQFKAGAPLNHTAEVNRSGAVLEFTYKLVGIGGEEYDVRQTTGYDNANKPRINVYKGDTLLASCDLEFG